MKTHVSHVLAKLGVSDRTQAALYVERSGRRSQDQLPLAARTALPYGESMPKAIVTGASRGLGRALARELAGRGWQLVVDARGADTLDQTWGSVPGVSAIAGDVTDADHRRALIDAVGGQIDLIVNNASALGPSPQPPLKAYPLDVLRRVYEVNVIPRRLRSSNSLLPSLAPAARILNVTSDAAVEPYGRLGRLRFLEGRPRPSERDSRHRKQPEVRVYVVDPGDMRTQLQQGGVSRRGHLRPPFPEESVPGLLALIEGEPRAAATPRPEACGGDRMELARASSFRRNSRHTSRPRPEASVVIVCG